MKILIYKLDIIKKTISVVFTIAICYILVLFLKKLRISDLLNIFFTNSPYNFTNHPTFKAEFVPFNPLAINKYLQGQNLPVFIFFFLIVLIFCWFVGIFVINFLPQNMFTKEEKITIAIPLGFLSLSAF